MRIKTMMTAAAVAVALTTTTGTAEAAYDKRCDDGGYPASSNLRAPKGTTCATARNVLDKYMSTEGLMAEDKIRVGRDGVLWKCYGFRASGKLNPWYVSCWSSQKTWHYNARYEISWWTSKSITFNYRTDRD